MERRIAGVNYKKVLEAEFKKGTLLRYAKGDFIKADDEEFEGEPGIFLIKRGYLKTYSLNNRGDQFIHMILVPGDFFPLTWLFSPPQPRKKYFMEVIEPTTVYRLPVTALAQSAKTSHLICHSLLSQTLEQVEIYGQRIDSLIYKYASERLISRLLFLAIRMGKKEGDKITLIPQITQRDLASSINMVRESLNREFDKLLVKGLVGYEDQHIVIYDIQKLEHELARTLGKETKVPS